MVTTTDIAEWKHFMSSCRFFFGYFELLLFKQSATAAEAPQLETEVSIKKLDGVAKLKDLDISTILAEQDKDPVDGNVGSWLCKRISLASNLSENQQSKSLFRHCHEIDPLLSKEGKLPCYNEASDKLVE